MPGGWQRAFLTPKESTCLLGTPRHLSSEPVTPTSTLSPEASHLQPDSPCKFPASERSALSLCLSNRKVSHELSFGPSETRLRFVLNPQPRTSPNSRVRSRDPPASQHPRTRCKLLAQPPAGRGPAGLSTPVLSLLTVLLPSGPRTCFYHRAPGTVPAGTGSRGGWLRAISPCDQGWAHRQAQSATVGGGVAWWLGACAVTSKGVRDGMSTALVL